MRPLRSPVVPLRRKPGFSYKPTRDDLRRDLERKRAAYEASIARGLDYEALMRAHEEHHGRLAFELAMAEQALADDRDG